MRDPHSFWSEVGEGPPGAGPRREGGEAADVFHCQADAFRAVSGSGGLASGHRDIPLGPLGSFCPTGSASVPCLPRGRPGAQPQGTFSEGFLGRQEKAACRGCRGHSCLRQLFPKRQSPLLITIVFINVLINAISSGNCLARRGLCVPSNKQSLGSNIKSFCHVCQQQHSTKEPA